MSRIVLALDLGNKTGWAVNTDSGIQSGTANFVPGKFDGYGMRFLRFERWLDETHSLASFQQVHFEQVQGMRGSDAARVFGGFLSSLSVWCEKRGIPYAGIPVGEIKRRTTGSGVAKKDAIIAAMRAKGHQPADDNEADALAILYLAMEVQ